MTPASFTWSLDAPRKGVARLSLVGDMTLGARDAMREAFDAAASATDPDVLLDFTSVRLVSSGAIGELVRCQSRLSAQGRNAFLVCPAGDVLETLMVADMHRLIPFHPDLDSYLKGNPS
jgi:anti-anti-sigma factor